MTGKFDLFADMSNAAMNVFNLWKGFKSGWGEFSAGKTEGAEPQYKDRVSRKWSDEAAILDYLSGVGEGATLDQKMVLANFLYDWLYPEELEILRKSLAATDPKTLKEFSKKTVSKGKSKSGRQTEILEEEKWAKVSVPGQKVIKDLCGILGANPNEKTKEAAFNYLDACGALGTYRKNLKLLRSINKTLRRRRRKQKKSNIFLKGLKRLFW